MAPSPHLSSQLPFLGKSQKVLFPKGKKWFWTPGSLLPIFDSLNTNIQSARFGHGAPFRHSSLPPLQKLPPPTVPTATTNMDKTGLSLSESSLQRCSIAPICHAENYIVGLLNFIAPNHNPPFGTISGMGHCQDKGAPRPARRDTYLWSRFTVFSFNSHTYFISPFALNP